MKRYRRPKVKTGQIKAQMGVVDGYVDKCIFFGDDVPRCDRALVMNVLFADRFDALAREVSPSLVDELELRGYDLDTLKFSIEKKCE